MPSTFLVMVDGLRPDAIDLAGCPNLRSLMARGSTSLVAKSLMPSITLPCHMSIFHSVPPGRHGVTSNDWRPMARPLPGLVDVAKNADLRAAFFYNWEPLRNLSLAGSLHLSYFRGGVTRDPLADSVIAAEAARYLGSVSPDFAFVYFGTVDTFGHSHGWMSEEYLAQVGRVDEALGVLLEALPAESTVLLQADHGGHDRDHGTDADEDLLIPWVVGGPGIRSGYQIQEPVCLLDTAPTLARIMGIAPHRDWEGHCIEAIFE